jgi:hypothetical protein
VHCHSEKEKTKKKVASGFATTLLENVNNMLVQRVYHKITISWSILLDTWEIPIL